PGLSVLGRWVVRCGSSGRSRKPPPKTTPALLTSTSIGPPAPCTCSRRPRMREASVRSTTYVRTRAPVRSRAAATAASAASLMSTSRRSAPSAASRVAIAFPIPDAAPVTSVRLPRSVFTIPPPAPGGSFPAAGHDEGDARDQRDAADHRRKGDRLPGFLVRLDRSQLEDVLARRVRDALVDERQDAGDDQQDPDQRS